MPGALEIQATLWNPETGFALNILISADAETPVSHVLKEIAFYHQGPYFLDQNEVARKGRFADAGLYNGAIITIGRPVRVPIPTPWELRVVGGSAAGARFPMNSRPVVVGRNAGSDAEVKIDDRALELEHFHLSVDWSGAVVEPLTTRGHVLVDGEPIADRMKLAFGEVFRAGSSLFEVRPCPVTDADIGPDGDGHLLFNRPPRILPSRSSRSFKLPAKPAEQKKRGFPWIQVIAPLILAVAATALFHSTIFLLFALMSPVMAAGTYWSDRREGKKTNSSEFRQYVEEFERVQARIEEETHRQIASVREARPDPVAVTDIATLPLMRMWERRFTDNDFLSLRLGCTERLARMEVTSSGNKPTAPPLIHDHPIAIDLRSVGVFGIAGELDRARAAARWLVAQIVSLHRPVDVKLVILSEHAGAPGWEWVRWLPHVIIDREQGSPFATVAPDRYSRDENIKVLLAELTRRRAAQEHHAALGPDIVVVYDGIRELRGVSGVVRLLKEGPEVGIFAIGVDEDGSRLAEEGKAQLVIEPGRHGIGVLRQTDRPVVRNVLVDQVDDEWAEHVARGVAPYTERRRGDGEAELPAAARFVELAEVDLDSPEDVLKRWKRDGRTTSALVGVSFNGPFLLDLKTDGPHGLVAGTTGSGKSEFLQTLVGSLALVNRPDAMNFLLIDYKGASAFGSCEELPHTVGLVTNLDGSLTKRALVSLEAELHRRERVFKELQASDIEVAWRHDAERCAEEGLARLVIVIDEFAELVQELPDFVDGLIRVARVGRSLGVHLILATQRPAGVVSAEMRANTGLRVVLRVEDAQNSNEVLESEDAANISRKTPGRAYARIGGGSALIPFQTARIAGRRRGATEGLPPPSVMPLEWQRLGQPMPIVRTREVVESETTDLHALVGIIGKAWQSTGAPAPRLPWLPPLPTNYVLPPPDTDGWRSAGFGLEDQPSLQRQPEATYDIEHDGHLVIIGSARAGRSTALRTLACVIGDQWSPADCHLYGMDFGNGALLPLGKLPHCGAVTARTERDRFERLTARLLEEVSRRQALFSRDGIGDIKEQRLLALDGEKLPYMVVLMDRWEGFLSEFPKDADLEMHDRMQRLVREGASVGLRIILAGDRSLLTDRISSHIEDKIVLRLNDKEDYALAGFKVKTMPDDLPPGRGIRASTENQIQFALLDSDPSSAAQNTAVARLAALAMQRWAKPLPACEPMHVDALANLIHYTELSELPHGSPGHSQLTIDVGVGGDRLTLHSVDVAEDGPYFSVAGPPKSGRSSALMFIAQSLVNRGNRVLIVAPRRSPLRELVHPQVTVFEAKSTEIDAFKEALHDSSGSVAIVVDDCEAIIGSDFDEAIRAFVKSGDGPKCVIVGGVLEEMRSALRGLPIEARKSKVGLLFSPESALDGDLVGLRLQRNFLGRTSPGRGLLCCHGDIKVLQVPVP